MKAKEASKAASTKKDGGLLGYFQVNPNGANTVIIFSHVQSMAESKKKGNLEFSLGNLFSCLCFTTEDQVQASLNLNWTTIVAFQGDVKKEVMMMADKLDKIEKALHIKQTSIPAGEILEEYGTKYEIFLILIEGEGSTRVMRHPTVKLTGGEEREEKKVGKKVGFNMEEDAEDAKPKRDGMVSLSGRHCNIKLVISYTFLCRRTPTGLKTTRRTRRNVLFWQKQRKLRLIQQRSSFGTT